MEKLVDDKRFRCPGERFGRKDNRTVWLFTIQPGGRIAKRRASADGQGACPVGLRSKHDGSRWSLDVRSQFARIEGDGFDACSIDSPWELVASEPQRDGEHAIHFP